MLVILCCSDVDYRQCPKEKEECCHECVETNCSQRCELAYIHQCTAFEERVL